MEPSLGQRLVSELGRRNNRGAYFGYEEYKQLPSVQSVEEMQALLDNAGFADVLATDDAVWITDGVEESLEYRQAPWRIFALAPTGLTILFLPLVLLEVLRRKLSSRFGPKRRFPSKSGRAKLREA